MSTLKKSDDPIRQNGQVVKTSQKHETNLQNNSILFFQVGLIVCLLLAYGLLEMKFEKSDDIVIMNPPSGDDLNVFNDPVRVYEEELIKEMVNSTPSSFKEPIITNNPIIEETLEIFTKAPVTYPISPSDIKIDALPEEIPIPIAFIEQVPIYPGCEKEKSNEAKRKCMSEKITKLVQKQFDTNLADELGLSGKQVIMTQFKIDKTGHVTDIQTRALHPKLKQEAERIINEIPEMTPGKQQNKNVSVIYSLPITFMVQN